MSPPLADELQGLMHAAAARRDAAWGRTLTFSPKVFLPITNLCRNRCDYCTFRRAPGQAGAWTMRPNEVTAWLDKAAEQGCMEALLCLGDTPETGFRSYRELLAELGFESTVDYLDWSSRQALERGLLPHTNAGLLESEAMARLAETNVSLGLMLECSAERLCERGGPHFSAPDKHPARRIAMIREAGRLGIPFTTGILLGIGETPDERVESLRVIAELHAEHGHIQEVIVQNFRAHEGTRMQGFTEPGPEALARAVAMARLILPEEVSVQAPPNLNPGATELLIAAGINDFGGISPLSPDYINPEHPWPHLAGLKQTCAEAGFDLQPRLPVYPGHEARVRPALHPALARAHQTLGVGLPC